MVIFHPFYFIQFNYQSFNSWCLLKFSFITRSIQSPKNRQSELSEGFFLLSRETNAKRQLLEFIQLMKYIQVADKTCVLIITTSSASIVNPMTN